MAIQPPVRFLSRRVPRRPPRRGLPPLFARWSVALGLALLAVLSARRAEAKIRVAMPEFRIEGSAAPALELQLQDGFVLGLVRAGVTVLDPVDTGRRLESKPEVVGCESSACLKTMGQVLDVRYVVRIKVLANGNSYKMVARLFSTEGAVPAALPLATKSMPCDVCTVAEARDVMLRLAEAIRAHLEEPPAPPTPIAVRPPAELTAPATLASGSLAVAATGLAILLSRGTCTDATRDTTCSQNDSCKWLGLTLLVGGAAGTAAGTYVVVTRLREAAPAETGAASTTTLVSLGGSF